MSIWKERYPTAYEDGRFAFTQGRAKSSNPYSVHHYNGRERTAWNFGYGDAAKKFVEAQSAKWKTP